MNSVGSISIDQPRAGGWLLLGTLILCALVSRLCYLIRPFDSDGAMFIYMGRLISEGGRFGHDLVDNKLPTVGLMTSACWRMFGAHWMPYVLLGAAMSMLAAWVLGRAARRNFGADAGRATLLFAIVYLNFNFAVFGGFQLETPQALLTSLAAAAALEALGGDDLRDAFTMGLCAGTAALLKPTGIVVAAAFAVVVVMYARSWRSVARLGVASILGAMFPLATALIYLIAADNLADIPAMLRQISSYAGNSAWEWKDIVKPMIVCVLAGFPMLVRGGIFRRAQDRVAGRATPAMVMFVLIWLALEAVGVAAQRRMYAYHFMVLAPPLALLFGMLPRTARTAPLAAALMPMALFSVFGASLVFQHTGIGRPTMAVSDYVNAHAAPCDFVWQDDAARLVLETNLRCGSRYPLMFLLANTDLAPLEYSEIILKDFEQTRPKYIVLRSDLDCYVEWQCGAILELERFPRRRENFRCAWGHIESYVRSNYEPEAQVGQHVVWRRKQLQAAQARTE
jgi:hypothetical protein